MTELRKVLVAALTLSLPISALAQAAAPPAPPAVQVYGTLNVNLQYTEAGDATAGSASDVSARFAVSTDSSNVGVRGTLKLNDALSATYQCETSANVDGEGPSGICNRNSRIGLTGGFGTVAYGTWDTPFKGNAYGTKADDPFGNTDVFGYQGLMGSPGYGSRTSNFSGSQTAATRASFDQRGTNSLAYWSPKLANMLTFRLQWSVDESKNVSGIIDPFLLSGNVVVDIAGFSVAAAAEYHEDTFGIRSINGANAGNTTSKDLGLRLAAGYELPLGPGALGILAMVEQLSYAQDDSTAGFKDYSRLAWLIGAKFRAGPHEVRARYTQAMDPDITAANGTTLAAGAEDDLAAQQIALGYAYHLGKATQVYAFYTQIMNDDRARYVFGVAGNSTIVGDSMPAGGDPSAFGIGMRQAF